MSMADYTTIRYDVTQGIATITLNRPDRYNALALATYPELIDAVAEAAQDDEVRVVVLTGAGKAFCSGADLFEVQQNIDAGTIDVADILRNGLNRVVSALSELEKPILGAINGVAAGAGASLALACDLRILAQDAGFVFASFANIGIIPDGGATHLLPRVVGPAKALELALFADAQNPVTGQHAQLLGLANTVSLDGAFQEDVERMASQLAQMPTRAVGWTKQAIRYAENATLAEALENEAQTQGKAFQTADFQEGVRAFIEKRSPEFKGK